MKRSSKDASSVARCSLPTRYLCFSVFVLVIVSICALITTIEYFRPIKAIYLMIQVIESESPLVIPAITESHIVPSVPSLMIIGPSKTGTTALIIELNQRFPNFIYDIDSEKHRPHENTAVLRFATRLLTQHNGQEEFDEFLQSKLSNAHNLSMLHILNQSQMKNHREYLYLRSKYTNPFETQIQSMLNITNSSYDEPPFVYIMDKCPRNFYNPHAAYLMATY